MLMSCFNCKTTNLNPQFFRNGWRLHTGNYAQLCLNCASVHEEGKFCETFHSSHDGWRNCESCGKLVHCGCIVSFNTHLLSDSGGIICVGCLRLSFQSVGRLALGRKRCFSTEPEVRSSETQFQPRVAPLDQRLAQENPKPVLTPLFDKVLSLSDADLMLARLIIPKRCAEDFFPDISGLPSLPIKIQDTEGSNWEFQYRSWLSVGNKIYALEGIRDHMMSKKWQPGDTVTFYRREPDGKLVIGLTKTSAGLQRPKECHSFLIPGTWHDAPVEKWR